MSDRYILESDVEFLCTLEKIGADPVADCFTLGNELGGVELGDDGFEDFVANGGENTLVVILAKILVLH